MARDADRMTRRERIVHADAIVTGDRDEIRDGAVVVDDTGEIIDVGPATDVLPRHAGLACERVRGVLLPGLVNAHTHIELSALRGQVPGGGGFLPWVEHMLALRAEVAPEHDAEAVERAVDELVAFGTAAVGDVSNTLVATRALARCGVAGWIFHEVFGVEREPLERRLAALAGIVEEKVGSWPSSDLAYAPVPHTLYTTHRQVAQRLFSEARDRGLRCTVHLSEHPAERRFLERGDGPVAEWYASRLKIPADRYTFPGKSPVAFADELGALAPHVACVHLTDARPDELELVARRAAPVVFCPRSNLFIEARLPPLLAARAAGILPALGTDSLASNASLDVLAEARALADRFPTVPSRDLVRMATWQGAQALGRADIGRIVRGARPGLVAVDGAVRGEGDHDACAFLLRSVRAPRRWIARRAVEAAGVSDRRGAGASGTA